MPSALACELGDRLLVFIDGWPMAAVLVVAVLLGVELVLARASSVAVGGASPGGAGTSSSPLHKVARPGRPPLVEQK